MYQWRESSCRIVQVFYMNFPSELTHLTNLEIHISVTLKNTKTQKVRRFIKFGEIQHNLGEIQDYDV